MSKCSCTWLVAAILFSSGCGRLGFEHAPAASSDAASDDDAGLCMANTCVTPPSTCFESEGLCTMGSCSYEPLASGTSCDDSDLFSENDMCDDVGFCAGTAANYWPLVFDNNFADVSIDGLGLDASGGLYAAVRFNGSWNGSGFDANLSSPGISYTNESWVDTAVMKLAVNDASPIWDNSFAGRSGRVEPYNFEVLSGGTTFVAGHLRGSGDFGGLGSPDVGGTQHPLMFTHDSAGTLSAMQFYEPGGQNAQIHGITIDPGFVAITGVYGNNVDFGAGGIGLSNGDDGYLAIFDRALNLQWARRIGGSGTVYGRATHITSAGVSWGVGDFVGTVDFGDGVRTTNGGQDVWYVSYDALGELRWSHTWGSSANEGETTELIGDDQGNTYVAGRFSDAFTIAGSAPLTTTGGKDIYVAAFDNLGGLRWLQTFGSTGPDTLTTIGFMADGSLWVAGGFEGTLMAGSLSATSAGMTDGFVAVLNSDDGTPTGLSVMASASALNIRTVAVDEERALVWVGGAFSDAVELGTTTVNDGKAYIYPFPFTP